MAWHCMVSISDEMTCAPVCRASLCTTPPHLQLQLAVLQQRLQLRLPGRELLLEHVIIVSGCCVPQLRPQQPNMQLRDLNHSGTHRHHASRWSFSH